MQYINTTKHLWKCQHYNHFFPQNNKYIKIQYLLCIWWSRTIIFSFSLDQWTLSFVFFVSSVISFLKSQFFKLDRFCRTRVGWNTPLLEHLSASHIICDFFQFEIFVVKQKIQQCSNVFTATTLTRFTVAFTESHFTRQLVQMKVDLIVLLLH